MGEFSDWAAQRAASIEANEKKNTNTAYAAKPVDVDKNVDLTKAQVNTTPITDQAKVQDLKGNTGGIVSYTPGQTVTMVKPLPSNTGGTTTTVKDTSANNTGSSTTVSSQPQQSSAQNTSTTMSVPQQPQGNNTPSEPEFLLNPLSDVQQPSYYFRWFMASDEDTYKIDSNNPVESVDNMQKIIIAETGATGFNIQDVSIDAIVGPNARTRNSQAFKIHMTLLEPYGISLIDRLFLAAKSIGVRNYLKAGYFLELKFHGYDDAGNYVDLIGPVIGQKKRWIWRVIITKLDAQLTNAGSKYDIEFIVSNEFGMTDPVARLAENVEKQATTVGEFLDGFTEAMQKADDAKYGFRMNEFKPIEIETVPGFPNPREWQLTLENPREGPVRSNSIKLKDASSRTIEFTQGTSVDAVIEYIFSHTREAQELIKRTKNSETFSNEKDYIVSWNVMCETKIMENTPYNWVKNDYNRSFQWKVVPYVTTRGTGTRAQITDTNIPAKNKQKLDARVAAGTIKKRYDYIFTGLNTEVTGFDIKFNTMWLASIPLYSGVLRYSSATIPEHYNSLPQARLNIEKNTDVIMKYEQNKARYQVEMASAKKDDALLNAADRRYVQEQINGLNQSITLAKSKQQDLNNDAEQAFKNTKQSLGSVIRGNYIEDIDVFQAADAIPITIDQERTDTNQTQGQGLSDTYDVQRTMFAAMINQVTGASTADLLKIELEIKGDPYWLGHGNVEKEFFDSNSSATDILPKYAGHEHQFVLIFSFPQGFDETTGNVKLTTSEIYNGIYSVIKVTHTFSGGVFKQKIDAVRDVNISIKGILR